MKNRKCAYCFQEKKLTKEHIWPKCIVKRTPELGLKFLDSKKIVTKSELVISDVCGDCNNRLLSPLDNYFCSLFDKYLVNFIEEKKPFIFEYNYDLLLRSILKITYNSSRTVTREDNEFERFRNYILFGNEIREDIVIKLDIITPSVVNAVKVYPKSARCGTFRVNKKTDNFILRMLSLNSFYFYILISKEKQIANDEIVKEFNDVFNEVPGTIIHPYQNQVILNKFSTEDTLSSHSHLISNAEHYKKR